MQNWQTAVTRANTPPLTDDLGAEAGAQPRVRAPGLSRRGRGTSAVNARVPAEARYITRARGCQRRH